MKRTEFIQTRLSDEGLKKVDELRGAWSRSQYMRNALAKAVKEGVRGPVREDAQDL